MIPFFSVVISVYNKAHFVAQTLDSILSQDFTDFEVLIVDDGSTDNSLEILRSFKDERITILPTKNQGVSAARNFGMLKARANYVALSDGDDIWLPNHLSELESLIESFPDCGIYATSYVKKFFNSYTTSPKFKNVEPPFFGIVADYFNTSIIDNILWTSAVVIPKSIINQGYMFDKELGCGEDIDLWVSIGKNFDIAFSAKVTAHKMIHAKDNHLSLTKNIPDLIKMMDKHKGDESINNSLKHYLDQNRYAAALEAKILGDYTNYKLLKKDIDFENLNSKLKFLLMLPKSVLIGLKKLKFILLKKRLYNSPYR
ncbi:glycosyltransferase family 2 protein [Winogradskyella sp. UBA3174]|uniref:glycosyltransferase family 2 protein n=1 Tax=Winogradskyella sp. UBA3174 TaxID=1947785 RepID=UPI0025D96880|nr:glycosyltransferase family A protein [Winogradskyella sp. UBA3174]|tara:strand:+ start:30442 stop:31383 length:942 start_codon:yes stop_codon:yes gene_type:complete